MVLCFFMRKKDILPFHKYILQNANKNSTNGLWIFKPYSTYHYKGTSTLVACGVYECDIILVVLFTCVRTCRTATSTRLPMTEYNLMCMRPRHLALQHWHSTTPFTLLDINQSVATHLRSRSQVTYVSTAECRAGDSAVTSASHTLPRATLLVYPY